MAFKTALGCRTSGTWSQGVWLKGLLNYHHQPGHYLKGLERFCGERWLTLKYWEDPQRLQTNKTDILRRSDFAIIHRSLSYSNHWDINE